MSYHPKEKALEFYYPLTPEVTVKTTVTGEARNIATVTILNITIEAWSGTMMQTSPEVQLQGDVIIGEFTCKKGSKFKLTSPSLIQQGNVMMDAKTKSGNNPEVTFAAPIASWPLTS